jgi:hypothetical protein
MATATPNILINSISGRIGNVVFYTRPGARHGVRTQCVRIHVIPRNPDTEAQRAVRLAFGDAVRAWQSLSPDERYAFNRKVRYLNMSGYNLYISNYIKRIIRILAHTPTDEPKSKLSSQPWNLNLLTLHLLPVPERSWTLPERIPSVSESYIKASGINSYPGPLKPRPG